MTHPTKVITFAGDIDPEFQAAFDRLRKERDRLALRVQALGDAIDQAEAGGATVVAIDVVRAHLGRPAPKYPG